MKWRKAFDRPLPEIKNRGRLSIKYKGTPHVLVYYHGHWYWEAEEFTDFPLHKESLSAIEWLDESPSLPSSSVTGEEDWKFKFSEWLINNRGLPPIVVDIIVAHVERYIVKSIPVTGEWQLCPKCNGEGFLQIGKAIPDGRIDFTCEVCNGKKILAKPGESEAIGFAEWMGKGFEMIIDGSWECFSEEYCEKYNLQLDEHYTTSELLSTYKQSKK